MKEQQTNLQIFRRWLAKAVADHLEDHEGFPFPFLEGSRYIIDCFPVVGHKDLRKGVAAPLCLAEFPGQLHDGVFNLRKFRKEREKLNESFHGNIGIGRRATDTEVDTGRLCFYCHPGNLHAHEVLIDAVHPVFHGYGEDCPVKGIRSPVKLGFPECRKGLLNGFGNSLLDITGAAEPAHQFKNKDLTLLLQEIIPFLGKGKLSLQGEQI